MKEYCENREINKNIINCKVNDIRMNDQKDIKKEEILYDIKNQHSIVSNIEDGNKKQEKIEVLMSTNKFVFLKPTLKSSSKNPLKGASLSPIKGKRFRCTLTLAEGPVSEVHNHIKRALWQRFGINRYSCNIKDCTYGGYNLKAIINHQYIIHNIPDKARANIRDIFEQHKEFYLSFKKQFIVIE
uniref:DUF1115 domain-containing protein n=1 Tax=Parastrongyloides trichosuri TaxID=131310 RepID=A0A0N4ZJF3_PARTI